MQKEEQRQIRKRKKSDLTLKVLQMLDTLVYTDKGLVNTICAPVNSSIYDEVSLNLMDMASKEGEYGFKESEDFYNSYLFKIIHEIQGMREIYIRTVTTLEAAKVFDRSLFEMRRELYAVKLACRIKNEHIRHSCKTDASTRAIKNLVGKYDSLRNEAKKKILVLNELINQELVKASYFIDSLSQQDSPQKMLVLINEINTNPNHEHIALFMEDKLGALQYKAQYKLHTINQSYGKPKIDEIIAAVNLTYRDLYNQTFLESIAYQPFIQMESKVVNNSIQMQFQLGSELFNAQNSASYQTSVFKDYPTGMSKSVSNATLTAEFLGEFLMAVHQNLYLKYGIQNYSTDVHVIGMTDGYQFKGAYDPKKEYNKTQLKDFEQNKSFECIVIRDINCDEHGLDLIDNASNIVRNYKDLEYLEGSYNNNIKLAYHRALNYWNVIDNNLSKNMEVTPYIYACNVPEKGIVCRRTEVGITFQGFPSQEISKTDLTEAEKRSIIAAFELAIK